MFKLFDFECTPCAKTFEEMIDDDSQTHPCPSCGGQAQRLIAAPHIDWLHMGIDPGFPSAYEKGQRQDATPQNRQRNDARRQVTKLAHVLTRFPRLRMISNDD